MSEPVQDSDDHAAPIRAARRAAPAWAATPIGERLEIVRRFRRRIGDEPTILAETVDAPWRPAGSSRSTAETLSAEILPLLAACRFLERRAESILAPRRRGLGRRPLWLFGTRLEIRREPRGVVLVIGPSNYPIFLAATHAIQALVAGNAVAVKPGQHGGAAMVRLARELAGAGLPAGILQILPESVAAAQDALDAGVDQVVLTGSADTGRAVLRRLADEPTPTILELSGHDAVIVRADADLELAARAVAFGLRLNRGFSCIAPKRLLVAEEVADAFQEILEAETGERRVVTPIRDDAEALRRVAECPYRLGASVFGRQPGAGALAERLDVGVVTVNDLIVPTADPRAPFGGRGRSGFGATRGAEGLLELTTPKTILRRRGRFRPHYDPPAAGDPSLFDAFIRAAHGSTWRRRLRAAFDLLRAGRARRRGGPS